MNFGGALRPRRCGETPTPHPIRTAFSFVAAVCGTGRQAVLPRPRRQAGGGQAPSAKAAPAASLRGCEWLRGLYRPRPNLPTDQQ
jgi:hypothetical protein